MKAYQKFYEEAVSNNWNKISDFTIKSFLVDRFEIWLDRANQEDYLVEVLKNGDLVMYKYHKHIEEKRIKNGKTTSRTKIIS